MHQRNLIAQNPDGDFVNVKTDYDGAFSTSTQKSAFGETLTASLTPVIQETFQYTVNTRVWDIDTLGSGTVTHDTAKAVLSTGVTEDSYAELVSKKRIKYRAGMGVVCRFTAVWEEGVGAEYISIIGVGDNDSKNGLYFSKDETGVGIEHYNDGVVVTSVAQAAWDDPCDGTSIMPVIDWTKGNVFEIRYQYLGYGAIRFYIENPKTGLFQLVHTIKYANTNEEPSLSNSTLPFRVYISNDPTGAVDVKLTNSGRTLLYSNTDSIAFEGDLMYDDLFHVEYANCDEFLAPQINKTCFIRNNEIVGQRHSGIQRDLTIDDFRKIPARTYDDKFEFNDTEIPNYFTADENKPMEGQELIFIHGKAGTGKSEIIKYLTGSPSQYTNEHNFKQVPTLSTAMTHAARQVIKSDYTLKKITSSLKYGHKIPDTARITIDEVSMMTAKNLESLNYWLIKHTGINRPFGGISIILFGHLAQLPSPDPESTPFHTSKLFKLFNRIDLTKNHSQSKDITFQSILNKIEDYYKVGGNRESNHYADKVLPKILTPAELDQLNSRVSPHPDKPNKYKVLQHSNKKVEESNNTLLPRPLTTGDEVVLRLNMKDMYNGNKYIIQSADKSTITINNKSFDRKHTTTQPGEKHANIQPTFASTIHCAQGQTHPVWINTEGINMGLLYVALSRAESLNDVQISKQF